MHPSWLVMHPKMTADHLGLLPTFLETDDPRSAAEQFNERYSFGGGWRPINGIKLLKNNALKYPGDPPLKPMACCMLHDELIVLYPADVVAIIQKDGSFEAARMD